MFKKREETGQSSLHPLPSFRPVRPSSPAPLFSFLGQAQPAPSFLFPSLSPADRLGPPVTFISPNRPPAPPLGSETAGHPCSDVRSPLLSLPRASVSSGAQCAQALPSPFPPSPRLCSRLLRASTVAGEPLRPSARNPSFRAVLAPLRAVVSIACFPASSRCSSRVVSWFLGPRPRASVGHQWRHHGPWCASPSPAVQRTGTSSPRPPLSPGALGVVI